MHSAINNFSKVLGGSNLKYASTVIEIGSKILKLKNENFLQILSIIVKSTRPTCNGKTQNLQF